MMVVTVVSLAMMNVLGSSSVVNEVLLEDDAASRCGAITRYASNRILLRMDTSPIPRHDKYDQKSLPVVCSLDEDDDEIDAVALPGVVLR